jgi:putative ABC transport system permease protein
VIPAGVALSRPGEAVGPGDNRYHPGRILADLQVTCPMTLAAVPVLLRASVAAHRGRFAAAAVAIALAAAVLLAALLGQRALRDQAPRAAQTLLADTELHVAATDTVHPVLDQPFVESLRADPRVARVFTAVSVRAVDMPGTEAGALDRDTFYSLGGGGMGGWISGRRDSFLAWDADGPRGTLAAGRWPAPDATDPVEVVAPRVWGLKVGAWRRLESDTGVHRARVVGVTDADGSLVSTPQGVRLAARQISRAAAERLAGGPRPPSDARLVLHRAEDRAAVLADCREQAARLPGRIEVWDAEAIRQAALVSPAVESARVAVLTAVLLVSACVVCIALGVQGSAVRERAAQLALLRALGAGRGTLAAVVAAEAAALTVVSLVGAVALAWGATAGVGALVPFLRIPAAPDPFSVTVTGAVVLAGVLAGSVWPAVLAARARPVDTDPARTARRVAVAAVVVAVVVAAVVVAAPAGSLARARSLAWVGIPGLALAAVLVTPLAVRAVGRLFVRPTAWLTRTDPLVLADQVEGDGPRSTGAVVAVAVGLGGFLLALCWGASMLGSFVIDPDVPRWLVSIHPYGLDRAETERALAAPALRGFQPLTLVDTRLGDGAAEDAVPTLVMGGDLPRALGDGPDALPFRFVAGDRAQAAEALAAGDACLVSDWYAAGAGVRVGDRIPVAVPGPAGPATRTYRVAGVVELRGWRMVTKQNKVRLRGDKHRVMLVLAADAVRRDFPVAYANFLLGNLPSAAGRSSSFPGDLPSADALAASAAERDAVEAAVAAAVNLTRSVEHRPDGGPATRAAARVVQTDDLDRTRHALLGDWGGGTARRMGWVPLVVLGLSLLSVAGALVASLRARGRELGVLRSCGLSRSGLARLALAESLLLGLAAVPVAAVFGGGGAWVLLEVTAVVGYRLDFAGIRPEFTVPWEWLWPGWALTALVCGLAAVWAGWRVGRTPPATLMAGLGNPN